MSCANMGISQLECLQLRRLVGPTGIGAFKGQLTQVNTTVTPTQGPSGEYQATYTSPFTVPSGTGLIRFRMQTTIAASNEVKFYFLRTGDVSQATIVPTLVTYAGQTYWFAEETIIYNNPTSSSQPLNVIITTSPSVSCTITYFEADVLSFGPYVQQE